MYLISYLEELPVTARDNAAATRKDPVLARLYDFTLHGLRKRSMLQCCSLTFHESKNFLLTEAVCCGVYVWLFLGSIVFVCWMTCTKNITESAG